MAFPSPISCFLVSTAVLASGCAALSGQTEYDYLTGGAGPRYLHDYQRPDPVAALGELMTYTKRDEAVTKAMMQAREHAANLTAITAVEEDIFLVATDLDGIGFTLSIHNGNVDLREGLRDGVKPSLVLPLTKSEMLALPALLAARGVDARGRVQSGITAESLFKLVGYLLLPGLEGLYSRDELYPKGDKSQLAQDDLVQFEVTPPAGSDLPAHRATVLNVDGQWLFLAGWHGDPDVRLSFDTMGALALYQAALYEPKKAQSDTERSLAHQHLLDQIAKATVYTRADHR